jgi:hypothetical protein
VLGSAREDGGPGTLQLGRNGKVMPKNDVVLFCAHSAFEARDSAGSRQKGRPTKTKAFATRPKASPEAEKVGCVRAEDRGAVGVGDRERSAERSRKTQFTTSR